jgi:hypothetical protein
MDASARRNRLGERDYPNQVFGSPNSRAYQAYEATFTPFGIQTRLLTPELQEKVSDLVEL